LCYTDYMESEKMDNKPIDETSRREFVKKLAYIAPAIVTLSVAPSFAKAGSCHAGDQGNQNCQGGQGH